MLQVIMLMLAGRKISDSKTADICCKENNNNNSKQTKQITIDTSLPII